MKLRGEHEGFFFHDIHGREYLIRNDKGAFIAYYDHTEDRRAFFCIYRPVEKAGAKMPYSVNNWRVGKAYTVQDAIALALRAEELPRCAP